MATLLVALIVLAAVTGAAIYIWRGWKKGNCCSGCGGCAQAGRCCRSEAEPKMIRMDA